VADVVLRLRYRTGQAPARPHGRVAERTFFTSSPDDLIAVTHAGALPIGPSPQGVPALTEPAVRNAFMLAGKLSDEQGHIIGLVTELEVVLPDSDLAAGRLRNRTLWTFFLPGRGAIAFDEREQQDDFVTTVIRPVLQTGQPWTGDLDLSTTVPGSASIVAGTGEFAGITGTGRETGHLTGLDPIAHTLTGTSGVQLQYRLPR